MQDPRYTLLQERTAQLRREAALDRLAQLAACCRPSSLRRARAAVTERLRGRTAPCCA